MRAKGLVREERVRRMRARAWKTLQEIWALDVPTSQTAIVPVADYLARQLKKASIVAIVSDFMTNEDLGSSRELKVLARRHDLIGVVVERGQSLDHQCRPHRHRAKAALHREFLLGVPGLLPPHGGLYAGVGGRGGL